MKYILFIFSIFISSCEIYVVEISDLTLSGKYVVSKLQTTSVDQRLSSDSLYLLGSTYINNNLGDPFDTIEINNFYIHFDYSTVRFNLLGEDISGRDIWEYNDIFYNVRHNNSFFLGVLQFDYITKYGDCRRMTFNIEDDGFETLQLKSCGSWPDGNSGEKQVITLFLTRVGP